MIGCFAPLSGASLTVSSADGPGRTGQCEPITVGLPLPRGLIQDPDRIGLVDASGRDVTVQAQPTERWPDGSIKWALIDFHATGPLEPERVYRLHLDRDGPRDPDGRADRTGDVRVTQTGDRIVVDTGAARYEMRPGTGFPFAAVTCGTAAAIEPSACALVVTDATGRSWPASITGTAVEVRGAVRSVVRLDGVVGPPDQPMMRVVARVHFFAGSAATRVAVTLHNPRRAHHAGGFWDLGDRGSVYFRDASIRIGLPAPAAAVEWMPEIGAAMETLGVPFEIYQDSSGGEHWSHPTHVNRQNTVPCTFRGYRLQAGSSRRDGRRATPAVRVPHAAGSTALMVEHFWQNFPKAIEVERGAVILRLWPQQSADVHELQGGERKTHRFTLAFGGDPMASDALFWGRAPALGAAAPRWYADAAAVPYLSPAAEDSDPRYQRLVGAAIEGPDTFDHKREVIDEYGWRNFGDIYADHENAFSRTAAPIISHYNNQYDAINGAAVQFMRSADRRWWRLMSELAAHVTDIDLYHTDLDKSAFNHGLFWHTYHYVPAAMSSHRSYPRLPGVSGGGPANEHNYAAGLRLHWLLTGDPMSRDAAIGLANWVIGMDDGRKSMFRWLTTADTGLASATQAPDFHGPGRGAGHSILVLLDGHRLTGDRRFLAKAEQLMRRCIHPADDVAALNLLDAERRWSYTVFLQAIGKYLDYKRELGEIDRLYAYGRAALLRYARWMADHEYPFLQKPEILEYPTETWAAQDMRKCEVFAHAAQHAAAPDRRRFIERAQFFFDDSVSTLLDSATRTLARPVVLMLSNGFMFVGPHAMPERASDNEESTAGFGAPTAFVPQKVTAKKRAAALALTAAALLVMALTTVVWMVVR
ncbi:MAG: hypothetical protein ABI868_04375 [Acidobacteriota bacterium]